MSSGIGCTAVVRDSTEDDMRPFQSHSGLVAANNVSHYAHRFGRDEVEIKDGGFVINQSHGQVLGFVTELCGGYSVGSRSHIVEVILSLVVRCGVICTIVDTDICVLQWSSIRSHSADQGGHGFITLAKNYFQLHEHDPAAIGVDVRIEDIRAPGKVVVEH